MAIRYKALTELYQETQRSVTAPDQWRAFLASACRNYRLSFDEQLLVYAQRPDDRRPGDRAMEPAIWALGKPGRKRHCRF